MGKGLKGILSLGAIGGVAFGGYKAYQEYEYLKQTHNNVVLCNGEKFIYDEAFEGDSIAAIMSGIEIDLREADFEADFNNLDIYGFASGFKILVPDDIKVIVNGVSKASGIEVEVDEEVVGKILNINYDLTASGLMVETVAELEEDSLVDTSDVPEEDEVSEVSVDDVAEEAESEDHINPVEAMSEWND